MRKPFLLVVFALALCSSSAAAQTSPHTRLCDAGVQNCRDGASPIGLTELIRKEMVAIDVGFWFMEDARYSHLLVEAWCRGVDVRVILDERSFTTYGYTTARGPAEELRYAHRPEVNPAQFRKCTSRGPIPMRTKIGTRGIFHFKTMIFAGQGVVEFSGANYSDEAFVPRTPYANYVDEVIVYSGEPSIVNSFKSKFDDVWTTTATRTGQEFAQYGDFAGPYVRTRCRRLTK